MKNALLIFTMIVPFTVMAQWSAPDANKAIFYNGGPVGISTSDAKGYQLAIGGKMITEEVVVKSKMQWPDFVFDPAYRLPPLNEVEAFIKANRHLPEIPASDQVQREGIQLAETSALLLIKIEELTLYLIQQEKRLTELHSRISELEEALHMK